LPKEHIRLPLGLRLWPKEVRAGGRRLKEGYLFSLLENSTDSYRFNALLDASKVRDCFHALSLCLPEEAFLILEFYQDQGRRKADEEMVSSIFYSPYMPTGEILEFLEPFLPRLVHDGFVGFGLANNRAGMEFFYSEEKILTCFSGEHLRITDLLARHGLPYRPHMSFPTDLGHDHLSLLCHSRYRLPAPFAEMAEADLDYQRFCHQIIEELEMYPVEETLAFFLSKKEQDHIEARLLADEGFAEFAEEDFGSLLLDWNDFVSECEEGFEGDLWEYRQCLRLRDMFQYVLDGIPAALAQKLQEIIAPADSRLQKVLVDRRKRLDPPGYACGGKERFWYLGIVGNQGVCLRRDLIRQGWFKP